MLATLRIGPFSLGVMTLVISFLVVAVAAGTWVSSLTATCSSCHDEQAGHMATSTHANISCYSCHLEGGVWGFLDQKASEVFRMYPAAAIGGVKLDGPGRPVLRATCVKCHENLPTDVLESQGLRIRHDVCAAAPAECNSCHNTVAHGATVRWRREPTMDDCLGCHAEYEAQVECDTCHAGKLERERLESGPWQVTHGPEWQGAHGMGDLATCVSCHPASKCIGCHMTEIPHPASFSASHGKQALSDKARCSQCHRSEEWCTACHGVEMPHPEGFLKVHSRSAKSRSDAKCTRCHAPEDCINCHVAHTHPGLTEGTMGASQQQGGTP